MTGSVVDELAVEFEAHRGYLRSIAFRMLGSYADADDAVQEAWLRLERGGAGIEELRGWLTTVTGRICLDMLRRRGTRAEQPLELWSAVDDAGPEVGVELAESVGLALYVVMDALTPAERVSFVLHDVFQVPFDTIAEILGRSTAASKMLASRARGRIRLGSPGADGQADRGVVDAFLAASGKGDVAGLLAVLAPEVELHAGAAVIQGAEKVAAQASIGARANAHGYPVLVDGTPGVLVVDKGRPLVLMAFTVENGRITRMRLSDPELVMPAWASAIVR